MTSHSKSFNDWISLKKCTASDIGRDLYIKYIEIVGHIVVVHMKNSKDNFCMRLHTLLSKGTSEHHKRQAGKDTDATRLSPTDLFGEVE